MDDTFTRESYGALLAALIERGYEVRGYADADPASRHLILRHDIDISLQDAEAIASLEADRGLRAHYFVLLRTELYNPFSDAARRSIDRIRSLGHEIGLHFDGSLYPDDPNSLDRAAAIECEALELAVGSSVRLISFHRPSKSLIGYDRALAGRRHAYEPRFTEQMGYCSDSRGAWHHGHPLVHSAVRDGRALQLLTHPIWWAELEETPVQRLDRHMADWHCRMDHELSANCAVHVAGRFALGSK